MPGDSPTIDEGLERLFAVVRANPRSTTFVALSHALCESNRAAEAEEVARQGLAQHPRLVTGLVALGRALCERGHLRDAIDTLTNAARANPEHGEVFRWLGIVLVRQGDNQKARPILEYADELVPGDRGIAELLIKAGGQPATRVARPRSDFESTRVTNAQTLVDEIEGGGDVTPAPLGEQTVIVPPALLAQAGLDSATPLPTPRRQTGAAFGAVTVQGPPGHDLLVQAGASGAPRGPRRIGSAEAVPAPMPFAGMTAQKPRPFWLYGLGAITVAGILFLAFGAKNTQRGPASAPEGPIQPPKITPAAVAEPSTKAQTLQPGAELEHKAKKSRIGPIRRAPTRKSR